MPKPILQSLILADHVYEDKLTGKRIIAGVFNRIIRGVRVLKEVTPPTPQQPYHPPQTPQWQIPQPQQPPAQQPVAPQPPYQPNDPIQIHSGQTIPASPPAQPSHAPPPGEVGQPPAAAPATPSAPSPATAVPPSAPAPGPTTTPTYAQQPAPAPTPSPPSPPEYVPPPSPPSPPLQPGQRVLEIPPTGLQSGSPFAYLSLTEVRGVTPLMLQLINLQDDTQLFRSDLRVDCPNPLYTIELTVPLPPISPPQAGIYALELLYNNELLGALRIVVEDAA